MLTDTIVVGYDGSTNAERALRCAAQHAAPDGVVHVVTAYRPMSQAQIAELVSSLPDEYRATFLPDAAEHRRLHAAEKLLADAGVACEGHLVPEEPVTAILDVAHRVGAHLIVVGSRGLGGVGRFLRGSVSTRVATHAPVSVLIVHDDA